MTERVKTSAELDDEIRMWQKINKWINRLLLLAAIFVTILTGSGLIDGLLFLEEGRCGVEYRSFDQLIDINSDTIAWIIMDGTHIDHPVVRSSDNFDYLDKGFDGAFYAGGTLFLDQGNNSFEDPYCIIHGHHMAAGAMFGDLDRYLNTGFFEKNNTGRLFTPEYDYDIEVFAAGIFDAYDLRIYTTCSNVPYDYIKERALNLRKTDLPEHILVLSTCLDDASDNRVAVFCKLTNRRPHKEEWHARKKDNKYSSGSYSGAKGKGSCQFKKEISNQDAEE